MIDSQQEQEAREQRRWLISLYSPNGQFGCLSIFAGPLVVTLGLTWSMRGMDVFWKDRTIIGGFDE